MTTLVDGRLRAWAWVEHLRGGGTTPWAAWSSTDGSASSRFLPGAQQLELLRRVNLSYGRPYEAVRTSVRTSVRGRTDVRTALADRILAASAPGRGRPDLELLGVDESRRFGPPPVDPATLPDDELLRFATGLLAEDLVVAGAPVTPVRKPRRLRVRYQLAGDPWLAGAHTGALTAAGRPPGGGGRAVHVLGGDVPTLLAHAWAAAAFGAGAPSWPEYLARVRARRRLPRRAALADEAERFVARPHTGLVQVVLDLTALPKLVGVRRLAPVPDVPATGIELARQVGVALSLHVLPAQQADLLTSVLRPRLARASGPLPGVPPEHADWVEDAAFALRQRLLRARYPVVGDPDLLLGTRPQGRPGSVLDLAMELLTEEER